MATSRTRALAAAALAHGSVGQALQRMASDGCGTDMWRDRCAQPAVGFDAEAAVLDMTSLLQMSVEQGDGHAAGAFSVAAGDERLAGAAGQANASSASSAAAASLAGALGGSPMKLALPARGAQESGHRWFSLARAGLSWNRSARHREAREDPSAEPLTEYDGDELTSTQKVLLRPIDDDITLVLVLCGIASVAAVAVACTSFYRHWSIGCRMSGDNLPHERAMRYINMFGGVPLIALAGFLSLLTLDLYPAWQLVEACILVYNITAVHEYLNDLAGGPYALQYRLQNEYWKGPQYVRNYLTTLPLCCLRPCIRASEPTLDVLIALRRRFAIFRGGLTCLAIAIMVVYMEHGLGVVADDKLKNLGKLFQMLETGLLIAGGASTKGLLDLIQAVFPDTKIHVLAISAYSAFSLVGLRGFQKFMHLFPFESFVTMELKLENGETLDEEDLRNGISSVMVCLASFLVAVAAHLAFPVDETTYPDVLGPKCHGKDLFTVDWIKYCPYCGSNKLKYSQEKEPGQPKPPQMYMAGVDTLDCTQCKSCALPLEVTVRRLPESQ